MLNRRAAILIACLLALLGPEPLALADPPPDIGAEPGADPAVPPPDPGGEPAEDAPPPPSNAVASGEPGYLKTEDGWELTVSGLDETQEVVAPLTTAVTTREYAVSGTFTGSVTGDGSTELTGATLEAGYRIGCGIIGGPNELWVSGGAQPVLDNFIFGGLDHVTFIGQGRIKVNLRPGTVTIVPVGEKSVAGNDVRITVSNFRVKVDGCVGQSFVQSYATLTSKTTDTSDIVSYTGVVKAP